MESLRLLEIREDELVKDIRVLNKSRLAEDKEVYLPKAKEELKQVRASIKEYKENNFTY